MPDALTDAQVFALTALLEVTPVSTVGEFAGETDEGDHVVSYRFATTLSGYPGWNWTIAVAHLPDEDPTIVESELLPADGALLAPDWIPWSERMEDYRAAQIALGEAASLVDEAADDDDDDDEEDDDEDVFGSDNLHGGDLDGVDIDEIEDELETLDLQVDEPEQPEAESDSGSEDPPRVTGRRKRASKEQQHNQGD
jgi:Protein of unknown function (DUF3027)